MPKELADFSLTSDNGVDHWTVERDGQRLFDGRFRPGRLAVPFPGWLYRPRLAQPWLGRLVETRFKGSGRLQLADLEAPHTGGAFPDVGSARPIGVVHLERFKLTFPAARQQSYQS